VKLSFSGRLRTPGSAIACFCAIALSGCGGGNDPNSMSWVSGTQSSSATLTDMALVSNRTSVVATMTAIDTNLSNPWGLVAAPGEPFWIADNNSNFTTLYGGTGTVETGAVTGSNATGIVIPASAAGVPANPTGAVYNGNGGFSIPTSNGQESALFLYDGEGGTIAGWAKDSGATAVTAYDDGVTAGSNHAVYKGLALGSVGGATFLYATDLHNNKIDVFDTTFAKPAAMQGKFIDPTLPAGYVPFGIAALHNQLYVTFALQDTAKHDEVTGVGFGYVDVFDFSGQLVNRFASADMLNAPWGIALAPAGFGSVGGDVLIGNFGDGSINAFKPNGSALASFEGPLTVNNSQTLAIPGLWSLVFGNGDPDKPITTLFYTAGLADQTDGVFGSISATTSTQTTPNPY
jgi:uncharacterized protein (TIGR03118 family)